MENSNELPAKFIYENSKGSELEFWETLEKPVCCGKEMYAAGGVLGNTETSTVMMENHWKCEMCGKEINDILY